MKRRINIDEAMMSSLGLVSEYENVDTNKINKVASSIKESVIEKYAGIFINNPTQENIEDFIRKYMYNELTFFPRILEVIVDFIPSAFSKSQPDHVLEGTGVVGIKVHHKVVELPFLVRDGELDPFDVIQMDGQRAPYSRENFQKIILNLDRQIEQEQQAVTAGGVESPYQGLEDYNNAATTPGFMGDVLAIRDSQSLRRGAGMYVTAGDYDYGFKKEAKIFGIKTKKEKEQELKQKQQSLKNSQGDIMKQMDNAGLEESLKGMYDFQDKQASEAENKLYPFSQRNRGSLEHQFEKAVAKVEAEKPTTKAPKGTVEKEREEEKLADEADDEFMRKRQQHQEDMKKFNNSTFAYNINQSIPNLQDLKPVGGQRVKFGDVSGEWFGDDGTDNSPYAKYRNNELVLGDSRDTVRKSKNGHSYGTFHVMQDPQSKKYYGVSFDNANLPSDYDMSRLEDQKIIEELPQALIDNMKANNLLGGISKKAEIITDLNALLEKTASIAPMTEEEMEAIAFVLSKKAHEEHVAKLDKIANEVEEPTRREMAVIEKKASFKFTDASSMKHGDFIVFPEIDGSEVSLTPAVILSDLDDTMVNVKGKAFKFVCSIDGRIKVLDGEKFLCAKAEDKAFKLPTTGFGSLKEGDTFFALKGNKVIAPSAVRSITAPRIGSHDRYDENSINKICNIFECSTIDCAENKKDIYFSPSTPRGDSRDSWRRGKFSIVTMDGKKFENTTMHEFLEAKSKETGLTQDKINAVIPRWALDLEENGGKLLTTDMQSPIIKVKGVITTNFKTQEEYDTKSRLHEAGYDVEKTAFTVNTVTVYCVDRKQNIFNITVEYKDTEERFMNLRKQIFNRVSKGKLKAILRILKFEGNTISEIIFKAKNEQKAEYPIPTSCTIKDIQELQGGDVHNVSKEAVKGAVQKYINPLNIAKGLALATASGLVTDGVGQLLAKHPVSPSVASKLGGFAKFFSESAELSGAFEKAAQEYESEDFLDYARVLALSGHFSEKVATALEDHNNVYPSLKDVAHEIVMAKPVLEKFAYDLTALKVNQSMHKTEMVPNNVIRGAIENMDTLYKMAYGIDNAISKDNLSFK